MTLGSTSSRHLLLIAPWPTRGQGGATTTTTTSDNILEYSSSVWRGCIACFFGGISTVVVVVIYIHLVVVYI